MRTIHIQRFWAKVLRTDYCWLWIGAKKRDGYGHLMIDGKMVRAHRFSYELFKGPIPKGLILDHLCLTPACVRPDHLEAVTYRENLLRGMSLAGIHSRRTHCARGHLLGGGNIRLSGGGGRSCLACHRAQDRERQRLKRASIEKR